ncbi:MAG: hypothetical protein DWB59_03215 [Anaerolineae bacterium]|nr:hypothetical protein [Anaerolineae bacterium]
MWAIITDRPLPVGIVRKLQLCKSPRRAGGDPRAHQRIADIPEDQRGRVVSGGEDGFQAEVENGDADQTDEVPQASLPDRASRGEPAPGRGPRRPGQYAEERAHGGDNSCQREGIRRFASAARGVLDPLRGQDEFAREEHDQRDEKDHRQRKREGQRDLVRKGELLEPRRGGIPIFYESPQQQPAEHPAEQYVV